MTLILVRHASAGDRAAWQWDDRLRPLDERGHRQALGLVDALAPYRIDRIFSSPYLRCMQTVEPFAAARGLPVEPREELAEDRQDEDGPAVVQSLAGQDAVLCTHGGSRWDDLSQHRYKKGAALVLDGTGAVERYLPPRD